MRPDSVIAFRLDIGVIAYSYSYGEFRVMRMFGTHKKATDRWGPGLQALKAPGKSGLGLAPLISPSTPKAPLVHA